MTSVALWLDGTLRLGATQVPLHSVAVLLDAIEEERSIRAAAERLDVSYRSVWGRLVLLEKAFGRPLVIKVKGHGSALAPTGLALQDALRSAAARLDRALVEESRSLEGRLRDLTGEAATPFRIACSHDPALMNALSGLRELEVSVVGSTEALERLASGRADAAGFHLCPGPDGEDARPAGLDEATYEVRPLFRREQGLIVAPGNPLGIARVTDLVRPDVTFVNRQKGSGTRGWTDHLLKREGVRPEAVRGYETEEFTHHAVAATVAARVASAGMGVRAAAVRLGLGFVSLAEETYFLATRRSETHPVLKTLLEVLDSEGGPQRSAEAESAGA